MTDSSNLNLAALNNVDPALINAYLSSTSGADQGNNATTSEGGDNSGNSTLSNANATNMDSSQIQALIAAQNASNTANDAATGSSNGSTSSNNSNGANVITSQGNANDPSNMYQLNAIDLSQLNDTASSQNSNTDNNNNDSSNTSNENNASNGNPNGFFATRIQYTDQNQTQYDNNAAANAGGTSNVAAANNYAALAAAYGNNSSQTDQGNADSSQLNTTDASVADLLAAAAASNNTNSTSDMSNVDLSNLNVDGLDLSNYTQGNNSSNVDLANVDLSKIGLNNTDLSNLGINSTDLSNVDLSNVDLSKVNLSNVDLSSYNVSIDGVDLSKLNLTNLDVKKLQASLGNLTTLNDNANPQLLIDSCNIGNYTLVQKPTTPYVASHGVNAVHNHVPRFGKPSDILDWLLDNDPGDYWKGAAASSLGILTLVGLWMLLLLLLKILGPKRVGFLSGRIIPEKQNELAIVPVSSKYDYNNSSTLVESAIYSPNTSRKIRQSYKSPLTRQDKQFRSLRITVLICGVGITICAILMAIEGIQHLKGAFNDAKSALEQAQHLADGALILVDDFTLRQVVAQVETQRFLNEINVMCPLVRNQICTSLPDLVNCDFTGIPNQDDIINIANMSNSFVYDKLQNYKGDIAHWKDTFRDVENQIDSYSWVWVASTIFATVLALLTIALMIGVVLVWYGKLNEWKRLHCFIQHGLFMPMYALLVFLTWICSLVFLTSAVAVSDACVDNPDGRALLLLNQYRDSFGSVLYDFATYYIEGCPTNNVPFDMNHYINSAMSVLQGIAQLGDTWTDPSNNFAVLCGTKPEDLQRVGNILQTQLCLVAEMLLEVQSYFGCDHWHPLYETIVYNALCKNSQAGFRWMAVTQIVIVFLAMVMLTCRVGFYDVSDASKPGWLSNKCCMERSWCNRRTEGDDDDNNLDHNINHTSEEVSSIPYR